MWIQISSGKGPDECELAVGLFLKTFINECTGNEIKTEVLESVPGNYSDNFKSVLLSLDSDQSGKFADGTIQWVCASPYRPNHRRKNWFISIEVYREPDRLRFLEKDLRFETMRSSGPGGQNVNKVETAVRAMHLPTSLTVTATEERSQYMNKKLALARLAKLLEMINTKGVDDLKKSMWNQHQSLVRGNPIRVYEGKNFAMVGKSYPRKEDC